MVAAAKMRSSTGGEAGWAMGRARVCVVMAGAFRVCGDRNVPVFAGKMQRGARMDAGDGCIFWRQPSPPIALRWEVTVLKLEKNWNYARSITPGAQVKRTDWKRILQRLHRDGIYLLAA